MTFVSVSGLQITPIYKRSIVTLHERDRSARNIPLDKMPLTVGRASTCDIQLMQAGISRNHAEIYTNGQSWFIVDNGSTNGSWLGGARLTPFEPTPWEPEEPLHIGSAALLLNIRQPSPPKRATLRPKPKFNVIGWANGSHITLAITNGSRKTRTFRVKPLPEPDVQIVSEIDEMAVQAGATVWMPFQFSVRRPLFGRDKLRTLRFRVSSQPDLSQTVEVEVVIPARFAY